MLVIVYVAEVIFDEINLIDLQSEFLSKKLNYIKNSLGINILNKSTSCIITIGSKVESKMRLKGYFWANDLMIHRLFDWMKSS